MSNQLRIYVAGRDAERAARVMADISQSGYTISYDWTPDFLAGRGEADEVANKASLEVQAIRESDLFVLLREPGQESALYEAGMAIGLGIPVVVVGNRREWFFSLSNVTLTASDADIVPTLARLSA